MKLASAVSLNIETPAKKRFDLLSDKKDYMNDIVRPLNLMSKLTMQDQRFSRVKMHHPVYRWSIGRARLRRL